jgi:hypothetical protein
MVVRLGQIIVAWDKHHYLGDDRVIMKAKVISKPKDNTVSRV